MALARLPPQNKKKKIKEKSSDSVVRGHRTRIFKGNLPEEGK